MVGTVKNVNHGLTPESSRNLYSSLQRCRKFEEKIVELYPQKEMRCPTHLSLGQEAMAAGVCSALMPEDMIFSTHRCHSHTIAKGGNFKLMMAELYGKATGCSKGKGGSMHFVQPEAGVMGASAIVGGTIPLAVGAALAAKLRGEKIVSVAFFGDGALEQGTFHESMNFSSLKKLPVVFVCENNFFATCTHISARQPGGDLFRKAEGHLVDNQHVDGTRAEEVYSAAVKAVEKARSGEGPTFIEGKCYRWKEHVGPNFDYQLGHRTKEELDQWMARDPVRQLEDYLIKNNLMKKEEMSSISEKIQKEIEDAVVFAKESPFPAAAEIYDDL